jgi:hypothetical protein
VKFLLSHRLTGQWSPRPRSTAHFAACFAEFLIFQSLFLPWVQCHVKESWQITKLNVRRVWDEKRPMSFVFVLYFGASKRKSKAQKQVCYNSLNAKKQWYSLRCFSTTSDIKIVQQFKLLPNKSSPCNASVARPLCGLSRTVRGHSIALPSFLPSCPHSYGRARFDRPSFIIYTWPSLRPAWPWAVGRREATTTNGVRHMTWAGGSAITNLLFYNFGNKPNKASVTLDGS